jgi:hypothetical protein
MLNTGDSPEGGNMNNNFIRLGSDIINITTIVGIWATTRRVTFTNGDYRDLTLSEFERLEAVLLGDAAPAPTQNPTQTTTKMNFNTLATRIKMAVDKHNSEHYLDQFETKIDRDREIVRIERNRYTLVVISDGVITTDELGNLSSRAELKNAINQIALEYASC